MLSVERLAASYGPAQVLFDISFSVAEGEVVTLIGRNGMGKTTTIFALMRDWDSCQKAVRSFRR